MHKICILPESAHASLCCFLFEADSLSTELQDEEETEENETEVIPSPLNLLARLSTDFGYRRT